MLKVWERAMLMMIKGRMLMLVLVLVFVLMLVLMFFFCVYREGYKTSEKGVYEKFFKVIVR